MRVQVWRNPGRGGFQYYPTDVASGPRDQARGGARPGGRQGICRRLLSRQLRAPGAPQYRPPGRHCSRGFRRSTAGVSVNRFFLLLIGGWQTIAMAANSIRLGTAPIASLPGGVESISIPGGGSPKESIRSGSAQDRARHLHGDESTTGRPSSPSATKGQPRISG